MLFRSSWHPQNLTREISKRAQDFVDLIGVFGLLGLLSTFLFINESDATLYRIAFPVSAIFGCATLISVVHPASRFAPILSIKPMIWIGERSYAIYLWHWIVFQVTRPAQDLAGSTWALYAFRILVVFALADISQRWIEIPVRHGAISNWMRGMKYRTKEVQRRQKATAGLVSLALLATIAVVSNNAIAIADKNNEVVKQMFKDDQVATISKVDGLWVIGDSVILGIRNVLAKYQKIELINARVGRQIGELIEVAKTDQHYVAKSPVILNMGNNNALREADVRSLLDIVKDQPEIIVVNTAVPRSWRESNNKVIANVVKDYSNATLVSWDVISKNHPEYFAEDGVHLNPPGVNAYVAAILEVLNK